jgi:hypothetical protein
MMAAIMFLPTRGLRLAISHLQREKSRNRFCPGFSFDSVSNRALKPQPFSGVDRLAGLVKPEGILPEENRECVESVPGNRFGAPEFVMKVADLEDKRCIR